ALRSRFTGRDAATAQDLEREWIHAPGRLASGAIGVEAAMAGVVQIRLGEDRPRRVAGAKKENRCGGSPRVHLAQQAAFGSVSAARERVSRPYTGTLS